MERRIIDPQGNPIGTMVLHDDTIPDAIMEGFRFYLAGSYSTFPERKFVSFMILPVPAVEAPRKPLRTYRSYTDPETRRFKIEMMETTTLLDTDDPDLATQKFAEITRAFFQEE